MRSIDEQTHQNATESPCNEDGGDPFEQEKAYSLPVDSFEYAITETHSDSSTGDAH